MRFRPQAGTLLASLLWALPGVVMLPRVALAQAAPKTALITAVRGSTLTLAVGTDDGAKIGQTYRLAHGDVSAKLQITAVTAGESKAALIAADPGFVVTVGETASYLGEEALAAPLPAAPTTREPLPALPAAPTASQTAANTVSPAQALITGIMGNTVTLGIGQGDGAVVGAVYALPLDGGIKARMQITNVRAGDSQATLTILEDGFVPTVGESARFVAVEAVQMPAPLPVETVPPVAPSTLPSVPTTVVPLSPVDSNGLHATPAPISSVMGSTATVTSIEGQNVIVSAGSAQGARTGLNLPILRGGAIIGLLRLQVVNENTSSGMVLWRDESLSAISAGDAVGILGAAPNVGAPILGTPPTQAPTATLVQYETGASNAAVPKADRTYELLAALASSGLIKSQPASIFQDDGARRHRTAEDIVFSRAQVATFIREAISNYDDSDSKGGRNRAALGILTQDYRRELLQTGETDVNLAPFRQGGVVFGISGYSRLTLAGGDTDAGNRDPFAEAHGERRSKSGYDTRTNIFGQVNSRLSFYGSFDGGNDIRRGNDPARNLEVRKAYVSYDASNLLKGLKIDLGRKEFWWGPGQFGTSVLSDASGGLDSLSTSFERGSYRLEGMYAYLGRGPAGGARSLYGQNLSVKVGNSARAGVVTTILSPKDKFDPKLFLGSFTPISLYMIDRQGSLKDNTNAVTGAYFESAVAKGARVYGEITLDDLSLNSNNNIENRDGGVVGAQFFNPKHPGKAGVTLEYARFNSLSYLAFVGPGRDADYFYDNRNAPLGYAISPAFPTNDGGAESLRFEGYYSPTKRLRLFAGAEYSDINAEDQNTGATTGQGFSRQQIYRLSAAYDLTRAFTLTARAQRIDTDQPNFVYNENTQGDRFFSLEIGRSF